MGGKNGEVYSNASVIRNGPGLQKTTKLLNEKGFVSIANNTRSAFLAYGGVRHACCNSFSSKGYYT